MCPPGLRPNIHHSSMLQLCLVTRQYVPLDSIGVSVEEFGDHHSQPFDRIA
jgi:hypothetical protein